MARSTNSLRSLAAVVSLVLACGCGGGDSDGGGGSPTPTGPSGPPPASGVANVSGAWNGTSDFEGANNQHLITTVSLAVSQSDRLVSGTVRFTAQGWESWRGTFTGMLSGPVDTEFLGTVNLQSEPTTGSGVCTGSMTMSGRVTAQTMRWDAPSLTMAPSTPSQTPACLGRVTNIAWIFGR